MTSESISRPSGTAIVFALLLGPSLLFPAADSANTSPTGLVPGAGGVQLINAEWYGPYPGTNVSLPAYACATLPCSKDLQAKLDVPAATFPAYVQVFYVKLGSGWQNQVFSVRAPPSIADPPHNMDLGSVNFIQYGIYVLAFANGGMQSTSWQYFQVRQSSPTLQPTSEQIAGTFKVTEVKTMATIINDGVNTTDSMVSVARNESTTPGAITGKIEFEYVRHVNIEIGIGTAFGLGLFTGTIAGKGPGECTYRISSILRAQGTSNPSSSSQHWLTDCTGGLIGITETSMGIGKGTFAALVQMNPEASAP